MKEVYQVMMTKNDILSKLTELKPFLYSNYSVKKIGLFGSYADDSYTENSDIDLLVELEKPIGWRFFSLEIFLEQIFNKKIDLITQNALKDQLRDDILKQTTFIE